MAGGIGKADNNNRVTFSDTTIHRERGQQAELDGVSIFDNDQTTETTTYENGQRVSYTKTLSHNVPGPQGSGHTTERVLASERYDENGNVIETTVETKQNGNITETTTYENGQKVSYKKTETQTVPGPQGSGYTTERVLVDERYDKNGNVIETTVETKQDGNITETTTYENGQKVSYKKTETQTVPGPQGSGYTRENVLVDERYDENGNVITTTKDTHITNIHVE